MIDWSARLHDTGQRWLEDVRPLVDAADPDGRVSHGSRLLCAGLAELATACHRALGGRAPDGAARAAALLALLTKVDDEIIDRADFHGGRHADRDALRLETRATLAPTLAALRESALAEPPGARPEPPRIALATEVGRALRALEGPRDRLESLLDLVATGWEIQEEAVVRLSADPAAATDEQIDAVTGRISGAWLLMITSIGAIAPTARRMPTAAEREAFWTWGTWIQRADGLADLARELGDGLIGTFPGRLAWRALGPAYLDAVDRGDAQTLYRVLAARDLDLLCLPPPGTVEALSARLSALGEVPSLLRWIHGFLLGRYLGHPLCARRDLRPFAAFSGGEALCSAR